MQGFLERDEGEREEGRSNAPLGRHRGCGPYRSVRDDDNVGVY